MSVTGFNRRRREEAKVEAVKEAAKNDTARSTGGNEKKGKGSK